MCLSQVWPVRGKDVEWMPELSGGFDLPVSKRLLLSVFVMYGDCVLMLRATLLSCAGTFAWFEAV